MPNVILTPHIGETPRNWVDIAHFVSRKIINYINTGTTW
jgi:D-3-phosphoglycerate dehydrogenase